MQWGTVSNIHSFSHSVAPLLAYYRWAPWRCPTRTPEPEAGEVRIRVDTAGVLLGDVFWQKGLIPGGPSPPFTPGYDVIGTADALGAGTGAIDVGQRVAALTEFGGYADYVVVPADWIVPVADDTNPVILSALVMSYLTAYQILHHVPSVSSGDQALIHGAAGSTGSAFLDLGQTMNLQMWGTASKPKHEIVKRYGARPIDYRSVDFVERMRKEAPDGVDIVVDPIGGRHLDRSWRVVNGRGPRCHGSDRSATGRIDRLDPPRDGQTLVA